MRLHYTSAACNETEGLGMRPHYTSAAYNETGLGMRPHYTRLYTVRQKVWE